MGDREALLGPLTLGWEEGLSYGKSTAVSARCLLVYSVFMKGLTN